jgi:hypothetical protein
VSTTSVEPPAPIIADDAAGRLAAWMDGRGLGAGAPLEHRYISGGSQNEIYEIRRGELHCALRIPPPSATSQIRRRSRSAPTGPSSAARST